MYYQRRNAISFTRARLVPPNSPSNGPFTHNHARFARRYEFFQPMMVRVVENKLRTAGDMKSKLCCVSVKEGRRVGAGLALALATNLTAEAGVDEWIGTYRCLGELDRREAWFRPMLNIVAKRLLGEVSWGLKMRVFMGAGLSIMDMATDIFVILRYMEKDETRGYGWSLLLMVLGSIVLQLLMVGIQNSKKPVVMLKEILIVLTGLKPAFDCMRTVTGVEMEEHHVFDGRFELVATKMCEMVCESIPGCLLQLYVLVKERTASKSTIGSVVISAMTTGFSSASISFDLDVDPAARKLDPTFYGYIPDGGSRTLIFGCMLLNSALLLLLRSFSAALLMLAKKRYLMMYMAGDMALYLLQKVARGDFHSWVPIDGALGLCVSLLMRVIEKTIVDYAGLIHSRGPQELGGLYWTANMFLALLASFGSAWVFTADGGGDVAWTIVGFFSGAWALVFIVFFALMKKEYRGTFFTTTTGKQQIMDRFKSQDESVKAGLFKKNKKVWREIKGEVSEWVGENWWRWKEERPEWFTASWVQRVPAEMIPADDDEVRRELGDAGGRRRSWIRQRKQAEVVRPVM